MKLKKFIFTLSACAALLTASCASDSEIPAPVFYDMKAETEAVISMIDAIETVDFSTEAAIDEAYAAYCFLEDEYRALVTNYEKLDSYRSELAKLYNTETKQGNRIDRSKVNIGTYCFNSQCWTDEGVKALADCGIDFISNAAYDNRLLDLLEKYNVGAFVSGVVPSWYSGGGNPANAGKMKDERPLSSYDAGMESFVDRDCIWAIDVGDEPVNLDLPHFGDIIDYIMPAFPNQLIYLNLLPEFDSYDYVENYLETYVDNVNLDYISYDHYVFGYQGRSREANVSYWLGDLQHAQKICNENNKDLWIVIQSSSNDEIGHLNEDEIRIQANLCLTFGAKELSWACWNAGWFNFHVADAEGNLTEVYDHVKKVNEEIHTVSPIYSRYHDVISGYLGQNIRNQALDTKSSGNLVQRFDVERISNCSVSEVYTDNDCMVAVGYFEKNIGDGSALMFTNMSNIYCTDESPAPVFFKVKDVNSKISAYVNGEAVLINNLGNGLYSYTLENASNLFVTIG